jgi:hypothetical protein
MRVGDGRDRPLQVGISRESPVDILSSVQAAFSSWPNKIGEAMSLKRNATVSLAFFLLLWNIDSAEKP